jgi:hypothetical protein
MKKIILLFVSVIFLLVSCNENKGVNVPTSDSINEIKVEKLFVVDGKPYIVSMMVAEWFILPIKKVWQRLFMTNMTLQQKPQEQRL